MSPPLTEIRLYGHLGREFGRVHRYAVGSPGEAVHALRVNYPRFGRHLRERSAPGYRILVGEDVVSLPQLWDPSGRQVIRVIPVIAGGANKGIFGAILGAALILATPAAGFAAFEAQLVPSIGAAVAFNTALSSIGWSLLLGGISQLLFSPPKPPGVPERPENRPSYVFDGPVNTTAQGNAVPIGYGRLVVGSQLISAGLFSEEI